MKAELRVPFNRPAVIGTEMRYVADVFERGHLSGDGPFTRRCSELLERTLSIPKALLTTSCTHALEIAALLLDLGPGDEVLVPSFTFVSTLNAFVLRGARPVFVDIRPDTLNLDERKLAAALTPRTKAIFLVHYAGVGCEMDAIMPLAVAAGVAVVEDNAHGLFSRYRGRLLGTFGAFAAQSFHETKNFSCGEGGALLVNDADSADRAEIIREKGTDRSRFFRGQVDKYSWVDVGSSYLPSEILAAVLYAQLEARALIYAKRRLIWQRYDEELREWAADKGVALPTVPDYCEQPYHMYYMLLPSLDARQGLISYLRSRGILAVFHYLPLHLSIMGRRLGGEPGMCPITERISDQIVRLPFYTDMSLSDQMAVIESIRSYSW